MTALRFNWMKKYMKNSFELHRKMVEMALQEGVSKTARAFGTTRKTVYKWLKRCYEESIEGLNERFRVPKYHLHQLPKTMGDTILAIRRQSPNLVLLRIQEGSSFFDSAGTVYRILQCHEMIRSGECVYQPKRYRKKVIKYKRLLK